jgi:malonyl-CoA O-methyltransferase
VTLRTRRIAARFGAAAPSYDAAAHLQRAVAERLAQDIAELMPAPPARILEFGCGTGFLTAHLKALWPDALLLATDLSANMASAAKARLSVAAVAMDAEHPALREGSFDLVCGSLAAQWFSDAPAALRGLKTLLAPGGVLALTTLGPKTFSQWRAARAAAGLPPGGLSYRPLSELAASLDHVPLLARTDLRHEPFASGQDFLGDLRAIGADSSEAAPLTPGTLRRALRALERDAGSVTYEVLTLAWTA